MGTLYDRNGNVTGYYSEGGYPSDGGDWSPASDAPLTWPARIVALAAFVVVVWGSWMLFRYAFTFLIDQRGVSWAGPKRWVDPPESSESGLTAIWGLILLIGSGVYWFAGTAGLLGLWGEKQTRGRKHVNVWEALGTGAIVSAPALLFIFLTVYNGGGWFTQPHATYLLSDWWRDIGRIFSGNPQ